MFRKSTTLPRTRRSTQFDAPPARTRLVPIKNHPRHRKRTAAPTKVKSMTPVPSVNRAVRAEDGKLAPRLKNPPAFSTYSSRIVSPKYDRPGSPANAALATCLVTRSHPIVAMTAISSTVRTPILAIICKSSAKSPRQTAYQIVGRTAYFGTACSCAVYSACCVHQFLGTPCWETTACRGRQCVVGSSGRWLPPSEGCSPGPQEEGEAWGLRTSRCDDRRHIVASWTNV